MAKMLECPSCGLHNRPGPAQCERCGAGLRGAVKVDVGPQRSPISARRIIWLVSSSLVLAVIFAMLDQAGFQWFAGSGLTPAEMFILAFTWLTVIKLTAPVAEIEVYYYTENEPMKDQKVRSARRGTLDAIAKAGGEPLLLSGIRVERSRLDSDGFVVSES